MYYQLISCEQRPSKYSNGYYWVAQFENIQTNELYETHIDPRFKNFDRWQELVKHRDRGWIISNVNLKPFGKKTVIDADSKFSVEIVCDRNMLKKHLTEWRATNNQYHNLFE